jgi:hypothetical protein
MHQTLVTLAPFFSTLQTQTTKKTRTSPEKRAQQSAPGPSSIHLKGHEFCFSLKNFMICSANEEATGLYPYKYLLFFHPLGSKEYWILKFGYLRTIFLKWNYTWALQFLSNFSTPRVISYQCLHFAKKKSYKCLQKSRYESI